MCFRTAEVAAFVRIAFLNSSLNVRIVDDPLGMPRPTITGARAMLLHRASGGFRRRVGTPDCTGLGYRIPPRRLCSQHPVPLSASSVVLYGAEAVFETEEDSLL